MKTMTSAVLSAVTGVIALAAAGCSTMASNSGMGASSTQSSMEQCYGVNLTVS